MLFSHLNCRTMKSIRTLIEKCNEYNEPLHLGFVDYNRPFDSVELSAIFETLDNARVYLRYKNLLKHVNNNATTVVKNNRRNNNKQNCKKRGIRQGNTIPLNLFTLARNNGTLITIRKDKINNKS